MRVLEAFADAIMQYEGWKPGSRSWRNRNPGNMRHATMQVGDDGGYAVFATLGDGWESLLFDIRAKCQGAPMTKTGLGPESTFEEFFQVWAPSADNNHPAQYAKFVAECLTKTCQKPFTPESKLKTVYPALG